MQCVSFQHHRSHIPDNDFFTIDTPVSNQRYDETTFGVFDNGPQVPQVRVTDADSPFEWVHDFGPQKDWDLITSPNLSYTSHESSYEGPGWDLMTSTSPSIDSESSGSIFTEDERRFVCAECGYHATTSGKLDEHAQTASHKAFACPEAYCFKRYARQDSFARHRNSHRVTGLICPHCDIQPPKLYMRRDHLNAHMKRKHGVQQRKPQEAASPMFRSKSSLSSISSEDSKPLPESLYTLQEKTGLKCVVASLRNLTPRQSGLDEMETVIDSLNEFDTRNLVEQLAVTFKTAGH